MPLILHNEDYMSIRETGGVWLCPLDRRSGKRHYLTFHINPSSGGVRNDPLAIKWWSMTGK